MGRCRSSKKPTPRGWQGDFWVKGKEETKEGTVYWETNEGGLSQRCAQQALETCRSLRLFDLTFEHFSFILSLSLYRHFI